LKIINFIPLTESYDDECDAELVSELIAMGITTSLEDLYVVGDDNEELECEGVTYYLSDYFNGDPIEESADRYIGIYERDGVRIAVTNDHGYTNWYIAKDAIKNIPPIEGEDYKKAKDTFWESWRNK
jgi:hypothetical protein